MNGEVKSNILSITAAEVPSDPTTAPTKNLKFSGQYQIRVEYNEITTTGGSPITSYELQMNDGKGGAFYTVHGGDDSPTLSLGVTVRNNIITGTAYEFRYRARNIVGWTAWSPTSSLSASTVPTAPSRPVYTSSTTSQIILSFSKSPDNGGALITDYSVAIDGTDIADYDFSTDGYAYTVNATALSLTSGNIYAFTYKATNENGDSTYSQPLRVGLGPLPNTPSNFVRATTGNTETSIAVSWSENTGEALSISYYVLYMDNGSVLEPTEVYRGSQTSYTVTGLTAGQSYSFNVTAANLNGESQPASLENLKSCVAPSSVFAPVLEAVNTTHVTLAWSPPGSDGG